MAVLSQTEGVRDGSGLQPLLLCRFIPRPLPNLLLCRKSGVGLGWYSVAPSALGLVESHWALHFYCWVNAYGTLVLATLAHQT